MKIISEIKIKVNGETCMAQVTEDGFAVFPDGTKKKLSEEQFSLILEKVNKNLIVNDAARPLTLPDATVEETFQPPAKTPTVADLSRPSMEDKYVPTKVEAIQEPIKPENKQLPLKAEAPVHFKNEKPKKEPAPPKPAKVKSSNSSVATSILAAGFVILVVMFMYASMSGLISFNSGTTAPPVTPPTSDAQTDDSTSIPAEGTIEDLDKAETILIVARIVTPEGKEKEIVLGYFTTDGESSTLPEIEGNGTSSDGESNSRSQSNSRLTLDEGFTGDAVTLANRYYSALQINVLNKNN